MSDVTHEGDVGATRADTPAGTPVGDEPTRRMDPVPPASPPSPPPEPPEPPGPSSKGPRRPLSESRKVIIAVLVALVLIAAMAAGIVVSGDDGGDDPEPTTTSTTAEPATTATTAAPTTTDEPATTAPSTTATTAPSTTTTVATTVPPVDTSTAVFPSASGRRFDDPVEAAEAFATDFVGFTDPLVGGFMQGDARSGEVEVRPTARGPVTTVFVRRLGTDGSWWVLGSATGNITTDAPATGDRISSPVTVRGSAHTFEGNVAVEVRADGSSRPIGTGIVTGGGDEMRPFEGRVAFTSPGRGYGSMLLLSRSAEDGRVWEASTFRIRF